MGRKQSGSVSRNLKGKGSGKPQSGNKKFKQRSQQNQKQLSKVESLIKSNKAQSGRSSSKQSKKKGFKNKAKGFNPTPSHDENASRQKGFKSSREKSLPKGMESMKTKAISKKSKQLLTRMQAEGQQQQGAPAKGNPLFQIIPEGIDSGNEDEFAALGQVSDSQQQENSQNLSEEDEQIDEGEEGDLMEEQEYDSGDVDQDQQQQQEGDDEYNGDLEGELQEIDEDEMEGLDPEYEGELIDQGDGDEEEEQEDGSRVSSKEEEGEQEEQENMEDQEQQGEDNKEPVDASLISLKIQETIQILMNVQKLGQGKPRKHFVEELKKLVHQYYGYNFELIAHFLDFLNPSEMVQFFESNETQRPLTIRTNTLKTRRKELAQNLIQRGVNLDPLADWSKVGIKIYDTKVPIGATPEYLAGHYMLQSASSLLPVIALDPQVNEKILDMASAPGGKTTYIAQLMKNTGSIFANDLKKERLRALQFNLYRLGISNTAVTCRDGRKFPAIFPGTFDRVLLDAPCTGLGIISKDHSIKANRVLVDIYKNSHLQKQLILAAIDCCKINGTVVYSTCSVSPLENEQVVNYALKRRFVKVVECEIEVGEQGLTKFVDKRFHVDLKKTRRIYPHVHNMDGFYVAKLIKVGKGKKNVAEQSSKGDFVNAQGDEEVKVDQAMDEEEQ